MSNYLAIATATAVLKNLVSQAVQNLPSMHSAIEVTSGRPEARDSALVGVNICLYQTTPNIYFRNQDLATRDHSGALIQVPMVPVNLHYLLTFYGKEQRQEAQRLLGATMAILHAFPVLTKRQIEQTVDAESWLQGSDLHQQPAHIKIEPVGLSLEELSKLWTVFFQTAHALSAAYVVSPILISPELHPPPPLPVRVSKNRRQAHAKPEREA